MLAGPGAPVEPFEPLYQHFDEQFRSFSHIRQFAAEVTRQAARLMAEDPTRLLAGFVIEDGAVRDLPPQLLRNRHPLGTSRFVGCSGISTRESFRDFLIKNFGAKAGAWFDRYVGEMPDRLPVVSIHRHGIRMAGLEMPGASDGA